MHQQNPASTETLRRKKEKKRPDPDDLEAARAKALALLTNRPRGSSELARKLRGAGFSSTASQTVVSRLTEVGLVDDQDLVERWVAEQVASGRGKSVIRQKLAGRGLWSAEAALIVDSHCDAGAELQRAVELAERRLGRLKGDRASVYGRLTRFLAQRGFSGDAVFEAARTAMKEFSEGSLDHD